MDSIRTDFNNEPIEITGLPDFQQVPLKGVHKNLLFKHLLQIGVWSFLIIGFIIFLFFQNQRLAGIITGGVFLLVLVFHIINSYKKQPLYGYALRAKDIIYQRGFVVSKTTVISFNRIQHVSINRSLPDKWLGLATLKIFTAGGSGSDIRIAGLEPATAGKIKEAIAKKIAEEDV